MKITLYTVNDCQFSKQEKDYLTSKGIQFEERNLETNREWLNEMLAVSNNFAGTPVTKIEKDNGQTVVLKGFTQAEFEKELSVAPVMQMDGATPTDAPAPTAPTPEPMTPPTPPVTEPTPVEPTPTVPEPAPMPEVPMTPPTPEPPMQTAPTMNMAPEPPQQDPVAPPMPPQQPIVEPPVAEPPAPAPQPPMPEPSTPAQPPAVEPPAPTQPNNPALSSILDQLQNKSDSTSQPTSPQAYN